MASLAFMLAAVAVLGVVAVVVVDEGAPVALQDKTAVHSLHFINSLHPEEAARAVAKDGIGDKNSPAVRSAFFRT